jgi:hypothetical protein
MGGGLIQLAIYGTQDIFLTGTPQITFFKIIYRRHTNFAMESIQQHFIGVANFGQEMTAIIDKLGDLMNRVYLEIDLPKIDLLKNSSHWKMNQLDAKKQYDKSLQYYQLVYEYISINTDIIRKFRVLLKTNNILINDIIETMNDNNFIGDLVEKRERLRIYITDNNNFNDIEEFAGTGFDLIQQINRTDAQIIFNSTVGSIKKLYKNTSHEEISSIIRKEMGRIIEKILYSEMKDFYMKAYNIYIYKQKLYQSFIDGTYVERYKFAWVEEIGHAIIDQIEIKIGSQLIDKHTGDWLILFNKIFTREYQIENYYKMIGNVTELTIFDDKAKNIYKLIIPFQFWFCRNTGLSLPLVALKYHDIMFTVKLKDLSKLCYVEDDPNLMDISNIQAQYDINVIGAKLYIDYIFLDSDERRRFAQSTHEYLIEIVQYNDFTDVIGKQYSAHLNFVHPTKFIIWFVQPMHYRENPTGRNKCQWNNFGTNRDKTGYTMKSAYLKLNSYNRTDPSIDINFYNYVQPYLYFRRSPTDGCNIYSFAIKPMEHQPSATINLSRIDDFSIVLVFTKEFLNIIEQENPGDIAVGIYFGAYIMSYNILRIISGMAGLAFQKSK